MSLPKIGGTLVLDNEAQFKKALAEVNAGLRVNQSQLKLVEEQSKKSGDAQATLKSKMDALSGTINSQKDKIALLEQAMEKSAQKTGEGSRQTMAWQEKLNYARRDLVKMEDELQGYQQELKDVQKKQEEAEKGSSGFAGKLKEVAQKLGVEVPEGAEKGKTSLSDVKSAALGVAAAIGGVVIAITKMVTETGKSAEEIKNNSQTMGMSMAQYQEWDYVFKSVGYSAEQASGDFAALAEKAKDAAEGTGEGAEAFDELGIRVTKAGGQLKSQNELFSEVITKLQNMDDATRRNALASQLLGTTGEELIPVLNMTGEEMDSLRKKAYETGAIMSDAAVNDFADMNQSIREMGQKFDVVQAKLAEKFLPVITGVLEVINSMPTSVLTVGGVLLGLGAVIAPVISAVMTLTAANKLLALSNTAVGTTATIAGLGLGKILLGIVAIGVIAGIIVAAINGIANMFDSIENSILNSKKQVQGMQQSVPKYAVGTRSAKKGFAIVGEQGPELVQMEGGERVYTAAQTRRMLGGASYTDNRTFIFKVDDIETYQKIMDRAKREQMQIRQGFVGV